VFVTTGHGQTPQARYELDYLQMVRMRGKKIENGDVGELKRPL
jgi:hypothetical protein